MLAEIARSESEEESPASSAAETLTLPKSTKPLPDQYDDHGLALAQTTLSFPKKAASQGSDQTRTGLTVGQVRERLDNLRKHPLLQVRKHSVRKLR